MEVIAKQSGLPEGRFSDQALGIMQSYEWPGHVRQLRNVVEWVMIMNGNMDEEPYESKHLPPEISKREAGAKETSFRPDFMALPLRDAREMFEREYLLSQVSRFVGNISIYTGSHIINEFTHGFTLFRWIYFASFDGHI